MSRDFRTELAVEKCWDRTTQALREEHGEPLEDAILQNREELIALCQWIEAHCISSYLELGLWTGGLISALHRLFRFERLAACDHGWAEANGLAVRVPEGTAFFRGNTESEAYRAWRRELGHIDLVFIDANHAYHAVKRDFEINRGYPHRFLAFHDITGATRQTTGVGRFWRELDEGHKREIIRPHRELGLDHSTMGIGIWSATEPP